MPRSFVLSAEIVRLPNRKAEDIFRRVGGDAGMIRIGSDSLVYGDADLALELDAHKDAPPVWECAGMRNTRIQAIAKIVAYVGFHHEHPHAERIKAACREELQHWGALESFSDYL